MNVFNSDNGFSVLTETRIEVNPDAEIPCVKSDEFKMMSKFLVKCLEARINKYVANLASNKDRVYQILGESPHACICYTNENGNGHHFSQFAYNTMLQTLLKLKSGIEIGEMVWEDCSYVEYVQLTKAVVCFGKTNESLLDECTLEDVIDFLEEMKIAKNDKDANRTNIDA